MLGSHFNPNGDCEPSDGEDRFLGGATMCVRISGQTVHRATEQIHRGTENGIAKKITLDHSNRSSQSERIVNPRFQIEPEYRLVQFVGTYRRRIEPNWNY
jgi:hypothetical protein